MGFPRSPETMGVSEERLESWRREVGHRAEEDVIKVLTEELGVEKVALGKKSPEEIASSFAGGRVGAARAPAEVDLGGGPDFYLFAERTAIPFDLTISRAPKLHAQKAQREREGGSVFLPLAKGTVDRASRGSVRDIEEIGNLVREGAKAYLGRGKV